MKNRNLDELIDACLDDCLSEQEASDLSEQLEASPHARARYWEMASVHGMLEQTIQDASLKAATGQSATTTSKEERSQLFQWRPIPAAAAGLVFGIFGATIVWAYAVPTVRGPKQEKVELFFENFEEEKIRPSRRFPTHSGEWFGDVELAGSESGIVAFKGDRMMKFLPVAKRKFSYARRIIELGDSMPFDDGQTRQLEVVASFAVEDSNVPAHFQIRLAAFSQEPSEVRPIWNQESVLFDTVLQHSGRNVITEPGQEGWQKIRVKLDVPRGARSLVLSLAAANSDSSQLDSAHYLDAVRANLILTRETED